MQPEARKGGFCLCGQKSGFKLGLGQANRALALFPLAALLHELDTFKTLEDGTLAAHGTGGFQCGMLGHNRCFFLKFYCAPCGAGAALYSVFFRMASKISRFLKKKFTSPKEMGLRGGHDDVSACAHILGTPPCLGVARARSATRRRINLKSEIPNPKLPHGQHDSVGNENLTCYRLCCIIPSNGNGSKDSCRGNGGLRFTHT